MRLNLGCGFKKLEGWINVDATPLCRPDQVVDLERTPWPWPDDSAETVLLSHVLEHLGPLPRDFLAIMRELWRICRPGAVVTVVAPHPRHDAFLCDPTHVRPITAESLALFSQQRNRDWIARGAANTPLGLMLGIDFAVERTAFLLDEPWRSRHREGTLDTADLAEAVRIYSNVVQESTITLRAIKPAGDPAP